MDLLETYGDFAVDSPQICGEKISVDPAQGYTRSVKSNHTLRVCFDGGDAVKMRPKPRPPGSDQRPHEIAYVTAKLVQPLAPARRAWSRTHPDRIPASLSKHTLNPKLSVTVQGCPCHSLLTTTSMFFLHFAKIF